VGHELAQHPVEVALAPNEHPVQALGSGCPDEPFSANAFARGALTGVRMTRAPTERITSSKGPTNLASRSRTKNRTARPWSSRVATRFRPVQQVRGRVTMYVIASAMSSAAMV
jgi:hypothetical protein